MIGVLIIFIVWLLSFVATALIFADKGIPFTFANFLLSLIPVLNTVITIKGISNGLFKEMKEMKDTLKTIFIKNKNYEQ